MPTRLWRILAIVGALFALGFAIADVADPSTFVDDHVSTESLDGISFARMRVTSVSGSAAENGGLLPGDIVVPVGGYGLRWRLGGDPAGTVHTWRVTRGNQPAFTAHSVDTIETPREILIDAVIHVVRFAMLLVGLLVALRRPDVPAARALASFLVFIALTMYPGGIWLPDPLLDAWRIIRSPLQVFSLAQGLLFSCIFPFASTGGVRAWLQRLNPWYAAICAAGAASQTLWFHFTQTLPRWGPLVSVVDYLPLGFFPLIAIAFTVALRQASGSDRVRIHWAAGSILVGFLGPIVQTILMSMFHLNTNFGGLLGLTLVALPIGLAYTILRHRTVDIGFVISRALVLTILSFVIVAGFGLLERALGKIFIDASHVASRSVEIALALGLGFSLRTLHTRIESVVDRFFFRARRRALAKLKTFASDVYFITDPDVAIDRTVAVVAGCADAEYAALYLIADGPFSRAADVNADALPIDVDENDPLLVRMRSSRNTELLRGLGSAIDAEIAFPMFVRGTLVGALVLSAKRSGEAYDPEETALISDLAQRVGLALDALQTLALRRELDGRALAPAR